MDWGLFKAGLKERKFTVTVIVGNFKNFASLTVVEPAKLTCLVITPKQIKLECGTIAPDGILQASYQEQKIIVTATVAEISCSTKVTVIEPAKLTTLVISPQKVEMKLNEHRHFSVQGLDQRGNAIAIGKVNWQATGGRIDQDGCYCTLSNQKGQFTLTATIEKFSISTYINVPPILRRLEIFPPQLQLEPEKAHIFSVIGFDQQDAEIAIEKIDWKSSKGGSITRQGLFQGGYSQRKVTVTASVSNVCELANVTLLPILRELQISPFAVKLRPDESQDFIVIGFDQYGDEIDPGEVLWEANGDEINQKGRFIADHNAKGQFLVRDFQKIKYTTNKNNNRCYSGRDCRWQPLPPQVVVN